MTNAVKLCSDGPWAMELTDLSFDPDPPSIKKDITEIWRFSLRDVITEGATFHEVWKVGAMVIVDRDVDLCSVLSKSGLQCPVPPGDYTVRYTYPVAGDQPNIPPFVTIKVRRGFYNADRSSLLCYDMTLKFVP
ncbi:MAG: ML domain-containing protein [Ardenticatenales bacterium]